MEVSRTSSLQQAAATKAVEKKNQQNVQREQQPEPAEKPKPKPVVNSQGQTTGRLVNATA